MCGFYELCLISVMEQGGEWTGCRNQPKMGRKPAHLLWCRKLLFSETQGPALTSSGKPRGPVIIGALQGSHSKGLCGAH